MNTIETNTEEVKILILVLGINQDPWKRIESEGQTLTWKLVVPNNIQIFRYVGSERVNNFWEFVQDIWNANQKIQKIFRSSVSFLTINSFVKRIHITGRIIDQELQIRVPEIYSFIGAKTLGAFELSLQNFDFDYIYRTNVSSYIDLGSLNKFIENKPKKNFYAGVVGFYHGVHFASGSGYFISRDLVEKVVKEKKSWDHNLVDDVSLGKLLTNEMKIPIQKVERVDLNSEILDLMEIQNIEKSIFHFRCKAENPDITISIMRTLHNARK